MKKFVPLKDVPYTKVIFETDLCKDVDDVGALALLCDAVHRYPIDLAGISVNVNGPGEAAAADMLLERFGFPQLPVCVWNGEFLNGGNDSSYVDYLSSILPEERRATLRPQEPIEFYRNLLSSAEDGGVVVISVGFFCNLNAAYQAMPELFARKVRTVVAMAGSFGEKPGYKEYNIRKMPGHAHRFLTDYPGEILCLPSEAGEKVLTDLRAWPADCKDPVYESYRIYTKEKLTRPSWDLLTVEFAIHGENDYYGLSPYGRVTVAPDSETVFEEGGNGNHAVVRLKRSFEETGEHISKELYHVCHK